MFFLIFILMIANLHIVKKFMLARKTKKIKMRAVNILICASLIVGASV